MTGNFHQHDDFLADLQSMRAALEARKDVLRLSLLNADATETAKLRQEVLALRELIMTIGESLWDEKQSDGEPPPAKGPSATGY